MRKRKRLPILLIGALIVAIVSPALSRERSDTINQSN